MYVSENVGEHNNTFNWPYDYCSLIELSKLEATTGFRPELEKEVVLYRGFSDAEVPNVGVQNAETLPRLAPGAMGNILSRPIQMINPLQDQRSVNPLQLQGGQILRPLLDVSYNND